MLLLTVVSYENCLLNKIEEDSNNSQVNYDENEYDTDGNYYDKNLIKNDSSKLSYQNAPYDLNNVKIPGIIAFV